VAVKIQGAQPDGGVLDYEELAGSPVESFDGQGPRATRRLKCAWADRYVLIDYFLGHGDGETHVIGAPYSFASGIGNVLYASSVQCTPFFPASVKQDTLRLVPTKNASYDHAHLEVGYELLHANLPAGVQDPSKHPQIMTAESLDTSLEYITLPTKGLDWRTLAVNTALEQGEAPGLAIPAAVWTVVRNYYFKLPEKFYDYAGAMNTNEITSNKFGKRKFPARTLMYEPGEVLESHTANRLTPYWRATMRFHYSSRRWDRFFRAETGQFENIYRADSTDEVLPYRELALEDLIYGV